MYISGIASVLSWTALFLGLSAVISRIIDAFRYSDEGEGAVDDALFALQPETAGCTVPPSLKEI
jgi:hypothetical protein